MASASGFIAYDPTVSSQQYRQWALSVKAQARYPELTGLGHDVIVTAAQLPAFAAHAEADPVGRLGSRGTFQVVPPGKRPYYCLVRAGFTYDGSPFPSGEDLCAPGPARRAAMSSRDSGEGTYTPIQVGHTTLVRSDPGLPGRRGPHYRGRAQGRVPGLGGNGGNPPDRARPSIEGLPPHRRDVELRTRRHRGPVRPSLPPGSPSAFSSARSCLCWGRGRPGRCAWCTSRQASCVIKPCTMR